MLKKLMEKDPEGKSVVPEGAFLVSTGQEHNKLIGMNAVHFAAEVGDNETLQLLIEHGIPSGLSSRVPTEKDFNAKLKEYEKKEEKNKRERIVANLELLRTVDTMSVGALKKSIKEAGLSLKGCVEKKDLQAKAREGIQESIDKKEQKRLKKESAGANKRARQLQGGLTPLHVAAMKNHSDFCSSLVKVGKQVDVNSQDCNGNTALHLAGFAGAQETWDTLENLGAKKRIKNNDGKAAEMAKDMSGCSIM
jgi:ankyrin repeat protein